MLLLPKNLSDISIRIDADMQIYVIFPCLKMLLFRFGFRSNQDSSRIESYPLVANLAIKFNRFIARPNTAKEASLIKLKKCRSNYQSTPLFWEQPHCYVDNPMRIISVDGSNEWPVPHFGYRRLCIPTHSCRGGIALSCSSTLIVVKDDLGIG